MHARPWLKYIHRVGYVTSVIVVLQLLVLSYIAVPAWIKREEQRARTSMTDGPAAPKLTNEYGGQHQIDLLKLLPPLIAHTPDGIRMVAAPSFGDTDFAISLRRTSAGADGLLVMMGRDADGRRTTPARSIPLRLSPASFQGMTTSIDAMTSDWNGSSEFWSDGTEIVLERVRGDDVTSGFGNNPTFHGKVGARVLDALRPVVPELARFDSSWHPTAEAERTDQLVR